MDLDTRHLRSLVAVVEEGTFTDAAIALKTSQASVSRSVQRLEATLGRRLLTRSSRHVEATPDGQHALVHARRILATLTQLASTDGPEDQDLQVGYAWAALGEHTVSVQRAWAAKQAGDLVFVQTNTPTAGLLEGRCEVSVVRLPVADPRLDSVRIGEEPRYAAVATDHPLAHRVVVTLGDFAGLTVAIDAETGTTNEDLWRPGARPAGFRMTRGIDEWLTLIAAGRTAGISSRATAAQHPRPGVAYRSLPDAPPVPVWLTWWKDNPPPSLPAFIDISSAAYAAAQPGQPHPN